MSKAVTKHVIMVQLLLFRREEAGDCILRPEKGDCYVQCKIVLGGGFSDWSFCCCTCSMCFSARERAKRHGRRIRRDAPLQWTFRGRHSAGKSWFSGLFS